MSSVFDRLTEYLTGETIDNWGSETPEACVLNERFNFKKYWNEYLTKLDERFIPWDNLKVSGGDVVFPSFRDNLVKDWPEVFDYSVILSRYPMSTEWYVQENIGYKSDSYNSGEEVEVVVCHKPVDFHRIVVKLFKGKDITVDEAVKELMPYKL